MSNLSIHLGLMFYLEHTIRSLNITFVLCSFSRYGIGVFTHK